MVDHVKIHGLAMEVRNAPLHTYYDSSIYYFSNAIKPNRTKDNPYLQSGGLSRVHFKLYISFASIVALEAALDKLGSMLATRVRLRSWYGIAEWGGSNWTRAQMLN
jgi:hypothetical protein